jgi:hypothetical protein
VKDNLHHVVTLNKKVMRHQMTKHGFIRPINITSLDFKLSFANCLEEEKQINNDEQHRECDQICDSDGVVSPS